MGVVIDGQWTDGELPQETGQTGQFNRVDSIFRNRITADGSSGFKAEPGRYHLYVAHACPWAHRTLIYRALKKLDGLITVAYAIPGIKEKGWTYESDPRYPDWPCAQAKVPEISLPAVWAGPSLDDVQDKWKDDAKVTSLVAKLAARRLPLDDAEKETKDYLASSGNDKAMAGKILFSGLFDTLNAQRSSVMSGIERVMRKQREAADKIRSDTLSLQAMQSAATSDQSKVDELTNQLLWETRIFEDRRRVVKYVCEVPTTIDQRLFALGRVIQQDIE